ncbi:hypothetical protein SNOG_06164 [Parastagonospora nodorum SN15]|uniref:Uncharacterized protein n=1 Tax=Phaeosphaeria nodorum (strain SN15 / ATCC MYA-4574 / FGSC 10173) TaxID=321614 RepID=Q0UQ00_PHANO|nr:hypothetical protein SNOG_06164 [Parastagonospora nodorum SN15]EAT85995.1 hypothetical protein SNOG_06164 [Parastagonospora nodorum SN15]
MQSLTAWPLSCEATPGTPGIPVADEKRASKSRGILRSGECGPARAACISWHVAIPRLFLPLHLSVWRMHSGSGADDHAPTLSLITPGSASM